MHNQLNYISLLASPALNMGTILWTFQHGGKVAWFNDWENKWWSGSHIAIAVPQGSILGPLLFLVYINDMSAYIHQCQLLKFADDAKCFNHIKLLFDQQVLQDNITALLLGHWTVT